MRAVQPAVWLLLAALSTLAAARPARSSAAARVPNPCLAPVPSLAGTRVAPPLKEARLPGPKFSLVVPPGYEPLDLQGVDSQVGGRADRAGRVISYDYGAGMDLESLRARLADYVECRDSIGGRPVLLTAGYDTAGRMFSTRRAPQYVAIAHWREYPPGPVMTLGVTSPDRAGLPRALAVLRSVRFP